jgi:methionine aminotransferase
MLPGSTAVALPTPAGRICEHGIRCAQPRTRAIARYRGPSPVTVSDSLPYGLPARSRLPAAGTTIFSVMSALAEQHGAINLGQGFPDYAIDPALIGLVDAAMRAGHNQYPLMPGVMRLREAIATKALALYGRAYDPEHEVTVTTGATQAIFTAIQALAHPGDEVVVFEPAYDSYLPAVELAGATPVRLPLTFPGFRIDWPRVRAAITPRTRMIVVNTPNNPGTSVLDAADVATLADITRGTPIVVISDEAYEHMVYDGARHESLARHAELALRAVVIASFGKTFHATGWKVGYALAPRMLTAEIRRVHQFTVFTVNAPVQHALASFLEHPERYLSLPAFFEPKRNLLRDALAQTPLAPLACAGSYFLLARYDAISDEPDDVFARRLVSDFGVAAIPLSAFYRDPPGHRVVRFCFAKRDATLEAAATRLRRLGAGR